MSDMSTKEVEELLSSNDERLEEERLQGADYGAAEHLFRMGAALRQLMNEQKWRDIASAPKDGTEILGWREDCGTLIVRWSCAVEFMTDREIEESGMDDEALHSLDWFAADFIHGCRLEGDEVPTLWLPLPSPPETSDD